MPQCIPTQLSNKNLKIKKRINIKLIQTRWKPVCGSSSMQIPRSPKAQIAK
jgi:hypothetical protein